MSETEHEAGHATGPVAAGSILDRLKEKRREQAAATTVDLPIAGWDGEVVARYRLLDPLVEGAEIAKRVRKQFRDDQDAQEFWALADTLIAACEGLYATDDEGALRALSLNGGGPATYTVDLASALGVEAATAREVVVGLFRGNKVALRAHALKLQLWMADPEGVLRLGEM